LVAQGLSNREIAASLVISEKTVKTHISSLLSKLGQEDRTRLAIYALKKGWRRQGSREPAGKGSVVCLPGMM